jgi:hypothetical protein
LKSWEEMFVEREVLLQEGYNGEAFLPDVLNDFVHFHIAVNTVNVKLPVCGYQI